MLVRAGAAARRRFLDTALCQMRPNYARYLEEYNRLHRGIKRAFCATAKKSLRCSPCGRISRCAWRISARRLSATARTTAVSCSRPRLPSMQISRRMRCSLVCNTRPCRASPTRLQTLEQSKSNLSTMCLAIKPPRLRPKSRLSGPHKDDLSCYWMAAVPLPSAPQGQVRTCTLSLKLAERELFFDEDGEYPVPLLDDVLSELDRRRQDFVLNRISAGQGHDYLLRGRYLGKAACRRGFPYSKRRKIRRNTLKSIILQTIARREQIPPRNFLPLPLFSFKNREIFVFP